MNKEPALILEYLKKERGFDFAGLRPSMLDRRVAKRLAASKSSGFKEYLEYLDEYPEELDRLIDVLTINVSRFFRDTLTFEYLADHILPSIMKKKSKGEDSSLRVWSAGCSYGEEPYSIAILINEISAKENLKLNVNIFATDIDRAAIKKARKAVYPYESIKSVKYRLLRKYFSDDNETYRLNTEIKKRVDFSFYDMVNRKTYSPPESIYGGFDMVLCRNLLIYFEADHQGVIFDKLYRSIRQGGYLVLGEAEIPVVKYQRNFRKVIECCNIYKKWRNV